MLPRTPAPRPGSADSRRPNDQPGRKPTNEPTAQPSVTLSASAPLGLVLLALLLALGPAGRFDPALGAGTAFAAGLMAATATFAALTLAEIATGWRARHLGLAAGAVVVSGWGPSSPQAEAARTWPQARSLGIVKPLATAGAGLGLLVLAAAALGAGWSPLAAALGGAALLVGALALLDLLPAPGRSGGLLVLARAWKRNDRIAGERAVARQGIRTGWALVALGFAAILVIGPAGLWFSLVGWLTLLASRVEQARTSLRSATAQVPARAAMTPGAPEVAGWHTVDVVLAEIGPTPHQVLPMRRFDGSLDVVLPADLYAVPGDDRDVRRAQDLARPAVLLAPDEPVGRLLGGGGSAGHHPPIGLVVDQGRVLGVVGPIELARVLAGGAAG